MNYQLIGTKFFLKGPFRGVRRFDELIGEFKTEEEAIAHVHAHRNQVAWGAVDYEIINYRITDKRRRNRH